MNFVLDSSLALTFVLEDEATEKTDALLERLGTGARAIVPALWRWETANGLLQAERRKRIRQGAAMRRLNQLLALPIQIDADATDEAWGSTLRLAEKHGLSCYDAAYLALAQRRGLSLGSLDAPLRLAAQRESIQLAI